MTKTTMVVWLATTLVVIECDGSDFWISDLSGCKIDDHGGRWWVIAGGPLKGVGCG